MAAAKRAPVLTPQTEDFLAGTRMSSTRPNLQTIGRSEARWSSDHTATAYGSGCKKRWTDGSSLRGLKTPTSRC